MSNTNVDILLLRDLESRHESVVGVVGGEDGEGGEDLQQRGGQRGGGPGPGPRVAATSRQVAPALVLGPRAAVAEQLLQVLG